MANGSQSMPRGPAGDKLKEFQNMTTEQLTDMYDKLLYDSDAQIDCEGYGLNGGSMTQLFVHTLGLHEKPVVLSQEAFDKVVEENGYTVLWRGVEDYDHKQATDIVKNTLYEDKTYVGNGIHGDGIYFSTDSDTAYSYAGGQGWINMNQGAVMQAFINPKKAKVIDENKLDNMIKKEPWSVQERFRGDKDKSIYALYKGYNVIRVKGGNWGQPASKGGEDYYIPINRSPLVFREPDPLF